MANELNYSHKFARSLKTYGYIEYRPNPNETSVVSILGITSFNNFKLVAKLLATITSSSVLSRNYINEAFSYFTESAKLAWTTIFLQMTLGQRIYYVHHELTFFK